MIRVVPTVTVNGPEGWRRKSLTIIRRTPEGPRLIGRIPWGRRRAKEAPLPMWVLRRLPVRLWAWVPR